MAAAIPVDPASIPQIADSDAKLAERKATFAPLVAKYSAVPEAKVIEKVVKSLNDRKFVVHVVNNKAEALKAALAVFGPSGESFSSGGCQSLTEIGFTEWAKTQTAHTNYKGLAIANFGKPDYVRYTNMGMTADHFFTTASAVTEDGRLLWASGSGTRVSLLAKQTVFIVGANKIVPNVESGIKRIEEYCAPLTGALVRQKYGFPDTYNLEMGVLNGQDMMNPNHFIVILVKESLGY